MRVNLSRQIIDRRILHDVARAEDFVATASKREVAQAIIESAHFGALPEVRQILYSATANRDIWNVSGAGVLEYLVDSYGDACTQRGWAFDSQEMEQRGYLREIEAAIVAGFKPAEFKNAVALASEYGLKNVMALFALHGFEPAW
jgi:hypothetical protein